MAGWCTLQAVRGSSRGRGTEAQSAETARARRGSARHTRLTGRPLRTAVDGRVDGSRPQLRPKRLLAASLRWAPLTIGRRMRFALIMEDRLIILARHLDAENAHDVDGIMKTYVEQPV